MEAILVPLYGACGILSAILYLPLIRKLLADGDAWQGHSLASWAGWLVISLVNLAYASLINGDVKFITAALLGACALAAVTGIILVRTLRVRMKTIIVTDHSAKGLISVAAMEIPIADNDLGSVILDAPSHAIGA